MICMTDNIHDPEAIRRERELGVEWTLPPAFENPEEYADEVGAGPGYGPFSEGVMANRYPDVAEDALGGRFVEFLNQAAQMAVIRDEVESRREFYVYAGRYRRNVLDGGFRVLDED